MHLKRIAFGLIAATLSLTASSAVAAPTDLITNSSSSSASASAGITNIAVESVDPSNEYRSTLSLKFDKPVSKTIANSFAQRLVNADQRTLSSAQLGPQYMSCGGSGKWSDSNGTLNLQYTCGTRDTIAWGYTISAPVRAIVVGNVNETGLRWWRNGAAMPQNSPHLVPANYLFHGSMTYATRGSTIDYQDYMTFRHNIGPGGTASITWAGRVHTLAD